MLKPLYLSYLLFLLITSGFSQNLVRNGSFEIGGCPDSRNYSNSVCESWNTISTADYFTACSKGEVKPEENFMGHQAPYSGKAFAGMFTGRGTTSFFITEVLYTELEKPLEKGEKYKVEFYYSLAENSGLISRAIGCAFTKNFAYKEVDTPLGVGYSPLFGLNYTLIEQDQSKLSNTEDWMLFQQEFIAEGGEIYLYISGVPVKGNQCITRKNAPPATVNAYAESAYYYIDEVSVIKQSKDGSYPVVTPELVIKEATKDYIFSNIYFETNSFQLNQNSTSGLDTLAKVLQENTSWRVTIQGHADAVGDEKENLTLSENRAKAVKGYLISRNIESRRIEVSALGSVSPLKSNASEEERAKNRRVEILLIRE